MSTADVFVEYQLKKRISDLKEEVEAKANTQLSMAAYSMFGCSGRITEKQKKEWLKKSGYKDKQDYINSRLIYYFGHLDPRKGKNMNEHTEVTVGDTALQPVEVKHFYIDDTGARVEYTPGDGETAPEETAFIAETDSPTRVVDPANTIH